MVTPPNHIVQHALHTAHQSPCRSKRGVIIWHPGSGNIISSGWNSPPRGASCPGREICAGTCGQRAIHAEVRALRDAQVIAAFNGHHDLELVHVEAGDVAMDKIEGGVTAFHVHHGIVACDGPSCGPCAAAIADVDFVAGVWLYETAQPPAPPSWRRYSQSELYYSTIERLTRRPSPTSTPGNGKRRHQ